MYQSLLVAPDVRQISHTSVATPHNQRHNCSTDACVDRYMLLLVPATQQQQ
jgi:hypothetical protein